MQRKINILYVITKLELGGAQTQLLSLIKGLDKNRYKIFLLTAWNGYLIEEALSLQDVTLHRSKYLERSIHPLKDLFSVLEIASFIKKNKIDIVHTHSSKAGIVGRLAARFAKAPRIVHTVHGWSFNDFQPVCVRDFYGSLERWCAKFTDKIIVVSEHDKEKGLKNRIGCDAQYHLARYGIDKTRFGLKDPSIRKELGIRDQDRVVGTIACLKPQKSPEDFVELAFLASRVIPDVKFLLVGDGVLRKKIEKLISRLDMGSKVILTGWRRDIPRVLSAMDAFVLTSLWEGLPISVLEAMASGVPVIATQTGGVGEVVEDGKNGFLVPCHDMPSMLKRLEALLSDAGLRERMGRNASRSLADSFSVKAMIEGMERFYGGLCNETIERFN